jgi:hypothetical protein
MPKSGSTGLRPGAPLPSYSSHSILVDPELAGDAVNRSTVPAGRKIEPRQCGGTTGASGLLCHEETREPATGSILKALAAVGLRQI